jgi:plasmid stabilization system protein ParE
MAQISWTEEARQSLEDFPRMGYRYEPSARHVRVLMHGHYRIAYLVRNDGNVVRVAEMEIPPLIGEARSSFAERFEA